MNKKEMHRHIALNNKEFKDLMERCKKQAIKDEPDPKKKQALANSYDYFTKGLKK
jgi:hypothetical protein